MADADEASRTAMRQLAYYVDSELDCAVHIALPEGENGEDVADWLEEGVERTAERAATLLQPYEPDDDDRTGPPSEPPPPMDGDIAQNDHYQVLGLAGDAVAIWWAAGGRVLSKSGESLCQPATLISIAPQTLWCRLAGADSAWSGHCKTDRRLIDSRRRGHWTGRPVGPDRHGSGDAQGGRGVSPGRSSILSIAKSTRFTTGSMGASGSLSLVSNSGPKRPTRR